MKIKDSYIAIKRARMPATDLAEVNALILRIAGPIYAAAIQTELIPGDGFDAYEACDRDGGILLRGTSGVALAAAFGTYLRERCGYAVGALTVSGTLPATPPPVGSRSPGKAAFFTVISSTTAPSPIPMPLTPLRSGSERSITFCCRATT